MLRITGGPAAGKQVPVEGEFQIGRSAPGDGTLGNDPELSRAHAKISRNPQGQLVVEDLGSTNGTAVNGSRITGPTVLNSGDTVTVGQSTISVQGGADQQATRLGGAAIPAPGTQAPQSPPTAPTAPITAAGPGGAPPPPPPPPPGVGGPGAGAPFGGPGGGIGGGPGAPGGPGARPSDGGGSRKGLLIGLGVLLLVVAIVAGVLLLTGGDDETDTGDRAAVESAVRDFFRGDCDVLTDDALEDIYGDGGKTACEDANTRLRGSVDEVEIDGDSASAKVEVDGDDETVELEKDGDDWLVSEFSGTVEVATATTPTETALTETTETTDSTEAEDAMPEADAEDPRKVEAVATLQAFIEAVQKSDEEVICGLLSPRQAQKLVGGPGGDAAIANCVQALRGKDIGDSVPRTVEVTGVVIRGNQASVRLTTGERFTLVRRGGRYVIDSGVT